MNVIVAAGAASAYSGSMLGHLAFAGYLLATVPSEEFTFVPPPGTCSSAILYGAAYGLGYFSMQLIMNYIFAS